MRILIVFLLLLSYPASVYSQINPDYKVTTLEDLKSRSKEGSVSSSALKISYPEAVPDTALLVRIPVVFNVIHLGEAPGVGTNVSDESVLAALDYLNIYYRKFYDGYDDELKYSFDGREGIDTKVEFYLADLDGDCNYSPGIRRFDGRVFANYESQGIDINNDAAVKNATSLDVERFLNIWVVNKIYSATDVIGYATVPETYGYDPGFGVVAEFDNLTTVLPHEIGHILGLDHSDMAQGGFTKLHSYKIVRNYANFFKNNLLGQPFLCTPVNGVDGGLTKLRNLDEIVCEGTIIPEAALVNYGASPVTACEVEAYRDGNLLFTYAWTGNLTSLDTAWLSLPQVALDQGNYTYELRIKTVNGVPDNFPDNNSLVRQVNVAGFISLPFMHDFENSQNAPIILGENSKSSASLFMATTLGGDMSILLEGADDEYNSDPYINTGEYFSHLPFFSVNKPFFSTASFCIASGPGKHYEVKYDRVQSLESTSLRVLANGNQVKGKSYSTFGWKKDSMIVSSYDQQAILVTIQASCQYTHVLANTDEGSYVALDNILVEEVPASDFVFDFVNQGPSRGCPPLTFSLLNKSHGAPMPVSYEYLIEKSEGILDTVRSLELPYGFTVSEEAVLGLKVYAHFADGAIDSVYYEDFINTLKVPVSSFVTEDLDNYQDFIPSDDPITGMEWQIAGTGAYAQSSKSYFLNMMEQQSSYSGLLLSLTSEVFSAAAIDNPVIYFDRAYASVSEFMAADEFLSVKISLDCGKTWTEVYYKSGTGLATVPYSGDYFSTLFVPGENDWARDTISLAAYANTAGIQIKFDFHPSLGNAFYLDNIIFGESTLITGITQGKGSGDPVNFYPNPATDVIKVRGVDRADYVTVFNSIGQIVIQADNISDIRVGSLDPGIYTVKIEWEDKSCFGKFVKK